METSIGSCQGQKLSLFILSHEENTQEIILVWVMWMSENWYTNLIIIIMFPLYLAKLSMTIEGVLDESLLVHLK